MPDDDLEGGSRGGRGGGNGGIKETVKNATVKRVVNTLRACMICNAIFLGAVAFLGPFAFLVGGDFIGVDGTFLCFYLAVFAVLICLSECRTRKSKPCLLKYFGFLFHYRGRMYFLLFIAMLALGGREVGLACGVFTCFNWIVHVFVLKWHPELDYGMVISYSGKAAITTRDVQQHYNENKETYDAAGRAADRAVPDSVKESAKRKAREAAVDHAKKQALGGGDENPW